MTKVLRDSRVRHLSLPSRVRTPSGVEFNPQLDHWMYRDVSEVISFRFSNLCLSSGLETSAKAVLVWYAERMASAHLRLMFQQLLRFALHVGKSRGSPISEFNDTDLVNYRASLGARSLWNFGQLSTLLRRWYEFGYMGVSEAAYVLLKKIRNPGVHKGRAVESPRLL